MGNRLELDAELNGFLPNVYFQAPSDNNMNYPCVIYNRSGKSRTFANNGIYIRKQLYKLMVIERDPDSKVVDNIEDSFQYCTIDQYFVKDNLHHTTINLYY